MTMMILIYDQGSVFSSIRMIVMTIIYLQIIIVIIAIIAIIIRNKKAKYHQVIIKGDVFLLVYLKPVVPLFLTAFLLCSILFSLVVNVVHSPMLPCMRRLLKLGLINKSHPHYGYPMPVLV